MGIWKRVLATVLAVATVGTTIGSMVFAHESSPGYTDVKTYKGDMYWAKDKGAVKGGVKCDFGFDLLTKGDNTKYSKDLAVTSSLLANSAYCHAGDKADMNGANVVFKDENRSALYGKDDITGPWRTLGFNDCQYIDIGSDILYDPRENDDITSIVLGHKELTKPDGSLQTVLVCTVRGTNGTLTEWKSNFDLGADTKDYYAQNAPHWANKDNHKGFEVAKNRVMYKLSEYIDKYCLSIYSGEKIILINGHSRGAAIANLLGKDFEDRARNDEGWKPFTYTFASPKTNTTLNTTARSYKTIWNVVNNDDMVPTMPYSFWGFNWYGQIKSLSIDEHSDLENGLEKLADWIDYRCCMSSTRKNLEKDAKSIAENREDIYKYPTGDYSRISGVIYRLYFGKPSKNKEKLDEWGFGKYCQTKTIEHWYGDELEVRPSPAFLMLDLAYLAVDSENELLHMRQVEIDGKYADFKLDFMVAGSGYSMKDPHYMLTYYVMVKYGDGLWE